MSENNRPGGRHPREDDDDWDANNNVAPPIPRRPELDFGDDDFGNVGDNDGIRWFEDEPEARRIAGARPAAARPQGQAPRPAGASAAASASASQAAARAGVDPQDAHGPGQVRRRAASAAPIPLPIAPRPPAKAARGKGRPANPQRNADVENNGEVYDVHGRLVSVLRWVFTSWDDEPPWDEDRDAEENNERPFTFMGFQSERGEEEGNLHWQGFVIFPVRMSAVQVRRILGLKNCYLRPMRGSPAQCIAYCSKSKTKDNTPERMGKDGQSYREFGARPRGTIVEQYENIETAVQAGASFVEIAQQFPSSAMRYAGGISKLIQTLTKPKHYRHIDVRYLWGPTRSGKSWAFSELFPDGYKKVQDVGRQDQVGFWEGYESQLEILLDDFRFDWPLRQLLEILDGQKMSYRVLYGARHANNIVFFITSNDPFDLVKYYPRETAASRQALAARIPPHHRHHIDSIETSEIFQEWYRMFHELHEHLQHLEDEKNDRKQAIRSEENAERLTQLAQELAQITTEVKKAKNALDEYDKTCPIGNGEAAAAAARRGGAAAS